MSLRASAETVHHAHARAHCWPSPPAVGPREVFDAYTWQLPGRIRYGRPLRLVIRGTVAALLCLGVLAVIPGDPATPPLVAALITDTKLGPLWAHGS